MNLFKAFGLKKENRKWNKERGQPWEPEGDPMFTSFPSDVGSDVPHPNDLDYAERMPKMIDPLANLTPEQLAAREQEQANLEQARVDKDVQERKARKKEDAEFRPQWESENMEKSIAEANEALQQAIREGDIEEQEVIERDIKRIQEQLDAHNKRHGFTKMDIFKVVGYKDRWKGAKVDHSTRQSKKLRGALGDAVKRHFPESGAGLSYDEQQAEHEAKLDAQMQDPVAHYVNMDPRQKSMEKIFTKEFDRLWKDRFSPKVGDKDQRNVKGSHIDLVQRGILGGKKKDEEPSKVGEITADPKPESPRVQRLRRLRERNPNAPKVSVLPDVGPKKKKGKNVEQMEFAKIFTKEFNQLWKASNIKVADWGIYGNIGGGKGHVPPDAKTGHPTNKNMKHQKGGTEPMTREEDGKVVPVSVELPERDPNTAEAIDYGDAGDGGE